MKDNCLFCNDHPALVNQPRDLANAARIHGNLCDECVTVYNAHVDLEGEPCSGLHIACEHCSEIIYFHKNQMDKFFKLLDKKDSDDL